MGLDIRPKNAKALFDFTFKNIPSEELEDWPDEEIKKATNWDVAIREFNKHTNFIFAITFGSPYPVNSFSVGAAEINGNKIHVRLFLFPMNKPRYQYQSIGQIICEFAPNSSSSDLKIWPDFLESNEINEETGKIVLIQMTLRWIDKLMKENPKSICLLKNENEISNLKLPNNPEESSQMFYLDDVAEIVNFIKDKIAAEKKIAILFTDENRGAFIVGSDLFNNQMGYLYKHSGIFSGSCIGRIENNGHVYSSSFGGSLKGEVDSNGFVYEHGLFGKGSIVGRVNKDGRVYSGSFGGSYLGRVDSNGFIYDNSGLFDGSIIGKAESPKQLEGGAAFLLLLR